MKCALALFAGLSLVVTWPASAQVASYVNDRNQRIATPARGTPGRAVDAVVPCATIPRRIGLVAHWPFNGDAVDVGPHHLRSTVVGSVSYEDAPGGLGIVIDNPPGESSNTTWISVAPDPGLQALESESFSIIAWYRTTDGSQSNGRLLGTHHGTIGMNYNAAGISQAYTCVYDSEGHGVCPGVGGHTAITTDGAWHSQALVVDRERRAVAQYVDGRLCESLPIGALGTVSFDEFMIGATWDTDGARATTIDDVTIYGGALTAAEIQRLSGQDAGLVARLELERVPRPR